VVASSDTDNRHAIRRDTVQIADSGPAGVLGPRKELPDHGRSDLPAHRRQNADANRISTVTISSLPAIMRKDRIHLAMSGRWA